MAVPYSRHAGLSSLCPNPTLKLTRPPVYITLGMNTLYFFPIVGHQEGCDEQVGAQLHAATYPVAEQVSDRAYI